jgi:hypothetical protein
VGAQVQIQFPMMQLHQGQLDFIRSTLPETAYIGGVGAGKSVALCTKAIILAHQLPNNRILITRKTYQSLNETTRKTFAEILPAELNAGERRSDDVQFIHAAGGGKSTIIWRSFEDSPADWQKFRSTDYGSVFIDEASETPRGLCDLLLSRQRTPVPVRTINYASNPTPKDHWLYDYFLGAHADSRLRILFRGTTYENRENLPEGYIDVMERTYSREMVSIMLRGEFGHIPQGLPVFEPFRRMLEGQPWHVRRDLVPQEKLAIARLWDFGVIRPCVLWAQFGDTKKILREKMGFNVGTDVFARRIKDLSTTMFPDFDFKDYCDPQGFARETATGSSPVIQLQKLGIYPVHLRKTAPSYRADLIIDALKRTVVVGHDLEPEFQVDETCEGTIDALAGGYRRAEPMADKPIDDEPLKDGYFEHFIDALGFGFVGKVAMGGTNRQTKDHRARSKQRAASY